MMTSTHDRDIRDEFMNITLLLLGVGLWALIVAGDLCPAACRTLSCLTSLS